MAQAVVDTTKKVTVNFPIDTYNAMADVASNWQISFSEALRRAIALLVFYNGVLADGDDLMVRNNKTKELEKITILH